MKRHIPTPSGNNAATEFYREQNSQTGQQLPFRDTHQVKVQRTTRGQYLKIKIPPSNSGAGGPVWL